MEASFPATVSIGDYAFSGCSALTEASFPAAVSIGTQAFYGCSALTEASFPAAESIGIYAFSGCSALTEASFPAAESIGDLAFQATGTTALTLTLGDAAPTLGSRMFSSVSAGKTVTVKVPSGATGYAPAYIDSDTVCWGNGFRGRGWNGSEFTTTDTGYFNSNITLTIQYE
jgi:hypothetical protein